MGMNLCACNPWLDSYQANGLPLPTPQGIGGTALVMEATHQGRVTQCHESIRTLEEIQAP